MIQGFLGFYLKEKLNLKSVDSYVSTSIYFFFVLSTEFRSFFIWLERKLNKTRKKLQTEPNHTASSVKFYCGCNRHRSGHLLS